MTVEDLEKEIPGLIAVSYTHLVSRLPIPIPRRVTWGLYVKPNFSASIRLHAPGEIPVSPEGLPMITGTAPQEMAAWIFSGNPPALPESFVTR